MLGEDASDPAVVGYEHADGKIQFWRNGDSYTTLTSKGLELVNRQQEEGLPSSLLKVSMPVISR